MENIKVIVEYINNTGLKGQVQSKIYYGEINFYAMTKLSGGMFSTFDQADKFMEKVGYYKLKETVKTKELADRQFDQSGHGPKKILNVYGQNKIELLGVASY